MKYENQEGGAGSNKSETSLPGKLSGSPATGNPFIKILSLENMVRQYSRPTLKWNHKDFMDGFCKYK